MRQRSTYLPAGILAVMVLACGSAPAPKNGDEIGAQVVCQQFVENMLKSPGTAEYSDESATQKGKTWTVSGSVDSQNSFGGVVRNNYVCTVKHIEGDRYELVDLVGLTN